MEFVLKCCLTYFQGSRYNIRASEPVLFFFLLTYTLTVLSKCRYLCLSFNPLSSSIPMNYMSAVLVQMSCFSIAISLLCGSRSSTMMLPVLLFLLLITLAFLCLLCFCKSFRILSLILCRLL